MILYFDTYISNNPLYINHKAVEINKLVRPKGTIFEEVDKIKIFCYTVDSFIEDDFDKIIINVEFENVNDQLFFNHVNLLTAGVRYLRAINSQFLLTDLTSAGYNFYEYKLEYSKYPEYVYHPNLFLDLGSDGIHVGPLSHKALAQRILDRIYYLND